ncbi:hypothetical protein DUI87_32195 [Hirundo rustica rustica]|uniref:Uncharacterized protein n=1 Tax=Hirundo rustica rustica TaxID=333673 RepID=A0A3M0IU51_HIRRU|nr:hypothetical protein DUI87_32181 [Hirundo rustica rustica]RMB91399.1 hypothetical protein DUI87_32190 [Hirundo rustica rustica]RMB91404.1 hypothetical protein DUI87_32195 [Hirundo rustica rustica]
MFPWLLLTLSIFHCPVTGMSPAVSPTVPPCHMDLVLAILDALESPVQDCGSPLPGNSELDRLPGDIDGPRARVCPQWEKGHHLEDKEEKEKEEEEVRV